jgi:hypothetical protein
VLQGASLLGLQGVEDEADGAEPEGGGRGGGRGGGGRRGKGGRIRVLKTGEVVRVLIVRP